MKPCLGIAGRLFGHQYEARFDSVEEYPYTGTRTLNVNGSPTTAAEIAEMFNNGGLTETYIHDVCVRCGDVIERKAEGHTDE